VVIMGFFKRDLGDALDSIDNHDGVLSEHDEILEEMEKRIERIEKKLNIKNKSQK